MTFHKFYVGFQQHDRLYFHYVALLVTIAKEKALIQDFNHLFLKGN